MSDCVALGYLRSARLNGQLLATEMTGESKARIYGRTGVRVRLVRVWRCPSVSFYGSADIPEDPSLHVGWRGARPLEIRRLPKYFARCEY